jgi:hypothetical protein
VRAEVKISVFFFLLFEKLDAIGANSKRGAIFPLLSFHRRIGRRRRGHNNLRAGEGRWGEASLFGTGTIERQLQT